MSWIRSRREPGAAAPSGVRLPFLAPGTIRDDVVAKVAALARAGSLDAGNGDVLDGWLGGCGPSGGRTSSPSGPSASPPRSATSSGSRRLRASPSSVPSRLPRNCSTPSA